MNKKLTLILLPLILAGCTDEPILYPDSCFECKFGEELGKLSWDNLGTVIPSIEGYSELIYDVSEDDFGDPILEVYLTYESEQEATQAWGLYAEACAAKGYNVAIENQRYVDYEQGYYFIYEVAFADRVLEGHNAIEIQSLVSMYQGKDALGIFAYNYVYCAEDEFPTAAVEKLLGDNAHYVPSITGNGYLYDFMMYADNGILSMEIVVSNCDYETEEEYFNLVKAACGNHIYQCDALDDDYFVKKSSYPEFEDQYYYYAFGGDNVIIIWDYDLYNYGALVIDIYYSPTGFTS